MTIIGVDEEMSKKRKKPCYFVKCDCGSPIKSILKSTLLDKRHPVSSCGCLVKEKAGFVSDREIALKKLLYIKMKDRHVKTLKKSLKEFINFEDFCVRIEEPCYYCGKTKSSYLKDRSSNFVLYYNGLDRIDSSKGYSLNNTVSCCKNCNIAKNDLSIDEFINHIILLHNSLEKKRNE